jgi:hypothetical protein
MAAGQLRNGAAVRRTQDGLLSVGRDGWQRIMKTLEESAFLEWAETADLCLDPQYPHSAVLMFRSESKEHRFWEVPAEPECRPYFISSLIELLGDWRECYAWRHLGAWPMSAEPSRINDVVEKRLLAGLGLPLGTADVVCFDRSESDAVIALIFVTTVFGWSVAEDLYLVPDHARCFLQTDHHHVIHASFRFPADVYRSVGHMEERGFPLPTELPDPTFKQPPWMA